jgi:hypothetical protein
MEISGHKTRAVFDRYHIVSERRMRQNAEKLDAHLKAKEAAVVRYTVPQLTGQDNGARQKSPIN